MTNLRFDDPKLKTAFEEGQELMEKDPDNILGVAIGFKYKNRQRQDVPSIRFFLKEKMEEERVLPERLIPKHLLGGAVPTDVFSANVIQKPPTNAETSTAPASQQKIRPGDLVQGRRAGTLGAFVKLKDGRFGILSAGHVMNPPPTGSTGVIRRMGRPIAEFSETLMPDQKLDAAIARLMSDVTPSQLNITHPSNVMVTKVGRVKIGDLLFKFGATTQLTWARVESEGLYPFAYDGRIHRISGFSLEPAVHNGQTLRQISQSGDSGALWYRLERNQAVGIGIHIDGNPDSDRQNEFALASHLNEIIEEFGKKGHATSLASPSDLQASDAA